MQEIPFWELAAAFQRIKRIKLGTLKAMQAEMMDEANLNADGIIDAGLVGKGQMKAFFSPKDARGS